MYILNQSNVLFCLARFKYPSKGTLVEIRVKRLKINVVYLAANNLSGDI